MSQYPPDEPPEGPLPPPPPPPGGPPGPGDLLPARTLGDILGAAFRIYSNNAVQLVSIVAIVVVPLSVVEYLIVRVALAPNTHRALIGGQSVNVVESRSFGLFILATLIAAAIGVIISAILQAATLRGAAQATLGDPVDIRASYRWGLRRFGSVLLVSILVGLTVAIGFVLLVIPGIIFLAF